MEWLGKLHYLVGLVLAFLLAFPESLILPVFFSWTVLWLTDCIWSGRWRCFRLEKRNAALYVFWAIFLGMLLSLFYTQNMAYAGKVFERRLLMCSLPLMASVAFPSVYRLKTFLYAFVLGAITALLYLSTEPILMYLLDFKFRNAVHQQAFMAVYTLTEPFKHRTYFGLVQLLSLICVVYLREDLKAQLGRCRYILFCLVYALSFFGLMYYLGGRIVLLMTVVTGGLIGVWYLFQRQKKTLAWIVVFCCLCSMVAIGLFHPRFQGLIRDLRSPSLSLAEREPRIGSWISALEVLGEEHQYLFGVGLGDVKDVLMEKYRQHQCVVQAEGKHHAHNNYLNMLLETGIPGLLLLLALLLLPPFLLRDKTNRFFAALFCVLFALLMLVEVPFLAISGLLVLGLGLLAISRLDDMSTKQKGNTLLENKLSKAFLPLSVLFGISVAALLMYSVFGKPFYDPCDPSTYARTDYECQTFSSADCSVPEEIQGCEGLKITSACQSVYEKAYERAAFYTSFVSRNGTAKGFSVWCYASPDFDGSNLMLRVGSYLPKWRETDPYDLNKKGSWQKLSIRSTEAFPTDVPLFLFFTLSQQPDMEKLQGYVVFAKPQFEE